MKYATIWGLVLWTLATGAAASDYYRLREIPTPEERTPDVVLWAAQFGVGDVRYSPERTRLRGLSLTRYVYVTPDGQDVIYAHPVRKHDYMWLREAAAGTTPLEPDDAATAFDPLTAAARLIEGRPDLRSRTWVEVARSSRSVRFREGLPGRIIGPGACWYGFDVTSGRVTRASEQLSDMADDREPLVSFEQAAHAVGAQVKRVVGPQLVCVETMTRVNDADWVGAPEVQVDDLQVRRVAHFLYAVVSETGDISAEEYAAMSATWAKMAPDERPFLQYPCFRVDATTGEIDDIGEYDFAPERPARRINLVIEGHLTTLAYAPVVVDETAYLYIGYLDSLLWDGNINYQEDTASVTMGDRRLSVNLADGEITGLSEGGLARAHIEHGRAYLPIDAFEHLTGWAINHDDQHDLVRVGVPAPLLPKMQLLVGDD